MENSGWGFGSAIGHLANGISYFSAKINESGFNESLITATCNSIKELSNTLSDLSDFKGKDLENKGWGFGSAIGHLAEGISYFSAKINECGFDSGKITLACNSIEELSKIISNLPDIKGKNLENKGWGLGSTIGHLANGISYFSAKINECNLDESKVTTAANSIKAIIEVFNNLPDIKGGDLENRGWGLGSIIGHLAEGISYFSAKINECNLDESKVTSASNSIKSISEVFNNLPDIKGGDLENRGWGIGSTIGHLANGISYFAAKINESQLDEGKITSASNSIKTLSEIIPNLLNIKGGDLENRGWGFGATIGHIANGISYFSAKINECNLDESKITAASNSIRTLSGVIPDISKVKGGDLENRGWGFGSAIGHLANGISYFSAKINECNLNESLITAACNSIKTLSDTIPNISNIKGGDLENKGWGFGATIGHLANGISYFSAKINECNLNESLITAACNSIKNLSDTISALPDMDGGTLENKGWGFGSLIGHLGNGIGYFSSKINESGFNEGLIISACNAINSLSDTISALPDMDGGTLENKGWGFGSAIGHLGNGISAFINGIGGADITNMESYISYVQQFANIASGLTEDAGTKLTNFAGGISIFATNFASFFNSLTQIGLETIQEGINKVNALIAMANSLASVSVESLSTFSNSLVQVATEGVNGFCNAFSGEEPVEQVKQAIITLIEALITAIDSKKQDIYNKFKELMDKALEAMKSKKQEFINVAKELCEAIITETYNHKESMYNAGADFTMGFVEGLRSKIEEAARAAAEMARAALQAAKAAIDSNSPSKETMALGGFFGEGFMIGIKSYSKKVYNEAYDVGDTAKDGLSRAISKISSIIDSGIETSPTIRPVLDLSDLESGVSRIDSMFNNGAVALNGNVDSISNNLKLQSQNGLNNSVEEAINNLTNKLQGLSGNTLNIYTQELDSNKLDQIVVYVDRQLGIKYLVK